jgi:hypothetical protein
MDADCALAALGFLLVARSDGKRIPLYLIALWPKNANSLSLPAANQFYQGLFFML